MYDEKRNVEMNVGSKIIHIKITEVPIQGCTNQIKLRLSFSLKEQRERIKARSLSSFRISKIPNIDYSLAISSLSCRNTISISNDPKI